MKETLEEGRTYSIEWTDGECETKCTYVREHRGFLIFFDSNGMKVFCRPTSIKNLTLLN